MRLFRYINLGYPETCIFKRGGDATGSDLLELEIGPRYLPQIITHNSFVSVFRIQSQNMIKQEN